MDAARWQRIEEAFNAVADLEGGSSRDARLRELCGADEALRAEVEALLTEDGRLQIHAARQPARDPHLGLRLGPFAVDRLIARGGMAAVYEAHRADDVFAQRVAVKIMDLRVSDPFLVAQFRAERQILAALEHPSLTRLLDGGVTALGEPYLVMEYVDGVPIDRYCDAHRPDVAGVVRLFLAVCGGVAYAHRTLVLHRDLKPSNLLVTAGGQVKVVDFGTATLLQPDRLATSSVAPLTPAYASPEQLTGGPVGTASDQYSLGLVLYELLTGTPPFGDRPSLIAAMERAMAGTTTTALHAAVTAAAAEARRTSLARLRRLLAGDLGTIVSKAVAADPASRYASVQHLADDLTRWLDGAPIAARPASMAHRTSRLVRRHWVAVTVAAALSVGLVAASAASLQQAAVARAQASIADAESAKARQLNRFLTQMLSSANPSWFNASGASANSITVRQVLDGATTLVGRELGQGPVVEAEMRRTIGRTYVGLGALDQAREQLERALALYQAADDAHGLAFTRMLLGEERLYRGDFAAGEALLREALAHVRRVGAAADPELHQIVTNDLAVAVGSQRPGSPEIVALFRESIETADRTGLNAGGASIAVSNLGAMAYREGRLDEADELLRDALRRMDALPARPPERSTVLNYLSNLRLTDGDLVEAERLADESVREASRIRAATHPFMPPLRAHWARTLALVGQLERARAIVDEVVPAYRRMRPAGHSDLVGPLLALGTVALRQGRHAEAEQVLTEALGIARQHKAAAYRLADVAGELGLTLRALGRTGESVALLQVSLDVLQRAYGDAHPSTVRARARLSGEAP